MKRRHFNPDVAANKRESLEWMRINAERERIFRFKQIAKESASQYYTIMERFSQCLMNPQRTSASRTKGNSPSNILEASPTRKSFDDEKDGERDSPERAMTTNGESTSKQLKPKGPDVNSVMTTAYKENQLHNVIRFMTDYLRQVIENGGRFTNGHFFILLLQLSASEVKNKCSPYVRVLVEEIGIPRDQFQRFISGLKDDKLATAFSFIEDEVFEAATD